MAEKYNKLFEEFPPISAETWKDKVVADLKGADFDRRLVWRTNEGFPVQPYYRQEDLQAVDYLDTLPGEFPYVRGNKKNNNDWHVRQDIPVTDLKAANEKALDILMKGVTSIGFVFNGCCQWSKDDMAVLLKDICLEYVEVNFTVECGKGSDSLVEALTSFVTENGGDPSAINASVSYDPFGKYLLTGHLCKKAVERGVSLIKAAANFPEFRVIAVNGKNYGNAGASVVQQLAFSLAQGAEYIASLINAGLTIDEVAKKIKFNFAVGPNYFMEIAGFRAGRMLWAEIVDAWAPKCKCACKMKAHAETGTWNKSFYDPYVNMLRTQTETMSAALGGVDSIAVLPFNVAYESPTVFSDRIARNQQLLLKEESHFDKIVDPAAGSYYIEELTASIADEAWKLFLQIQDKGGFIAAAKEGFIQGQIKEMAAKRDKDVATRRENLLGINQFPNFTECFGQSVDDSVFEPLDLRREDAEIDTIKLYRGAQMFEKIRIATDRYSKGNKRPLVFMLTIGDLAMRKARAQFSCNFFAVAGYEVQDNNGFETIAEGIAEAKKAGADIIVLCSSDDEYAVFAPEAFDLIGNDAIFVVAGAPACTDELVAKGITNFINVKSNLLNELKSYQSKLNI